ncbi:hypothetical protein EV426DRAFT_72220 [Tirmania nivea]|nr:hypothetical protein EV426DRAFT_72220 [Tirmania nivea]
MEHPYPVHLRRPSITALENLVLASEDDLKATADKSLSVQFPLYLSNNSGLDVELPDLIHITTMDTWPIPPKATPPLPSAEGEADMSQQLRTLSETAIWYDEALFSPAITVPKANTANVDWYGGSLWRGLSLDFYHLPPPSQVPAFAPTSSSFGILLPGPIPISARSGDSLPGHHSNTSNWTYIPTAQTNNMQYPYVFPTTTTPPQQPVQLLTTLACLNSNFEPGAMNFNTWSSLQQTNYMSLFETSFLQPPYEPTNDTHENSEELRRIWATLFNGMGEENVSWMNSQSNGLSGEERNDAVW